MLPTSVALLPQKNRSQVIWILQPIFNGRANSKTPELFTFLCKTRKLNDAKCYFQGCPEELDQGPKGPHLCGHDEAKWPRYYQEFVSGLGVGENSGFQTVIPQFQLV